MINNVYFPQNFHSKEIIFLLMPSTDLVRSTISSILSSFASSSLMGNLLFQTRSIQARGETIGDAQNYLVPPVTLLRRHK